MRKWCAVGRVGVRAALDRRGGEGVRRCGGGVAFSRRGGVVFLCEQGEHGHRGHTQRAYYYMSSAVARLRGVV